jgi:hypothetical protein
VRSSITHPLAVTTVYLRRLEGEADRTRPDVTLAIGADWKAPVWRRGCRCHRTMIDLLAPDWSLYGLVWLGKSDQAIEPRLAETVGALGRARLGT